MKPYEKIIITPKGKILEKGLQNGLISRILLEPSAEYEEEVLKPLKIMGAEIRKEEEKQMKIAEKMKEMAERELEKEKP